MTSAPVRSLTRRDRQLACTLLGASFACNVGVLFIPFMNLRRGLSSEPYSLFHSVEMFWRNGLYVLAALVVGFSIVFPFAKLAVLGAVVASRQPDASLLRWLHFVERHGKWSMLDVFLVCLILVLTSEQLFVGAEPLAGIPLFITAIALSMVVGEYLSGRLRPPHEREEQPPVPPRGWWLALSGLALGATLALPFLGIADWRLVNRDYSIITLVPVLWNQSTHLGAGLTGAFLVLAPLAAWMTSFASWWRLRQKEDNQDLNAWAAGFRRWSMLEVFGLALAVFALEGEHLMKTEMRWGALLLAGTLALQRAFDTALNRRGVG